MRSVPGHPQPVEEIVLRPPPVLPGPDHGGGALAAVLPMLASLGSVAVMATVVAPPEHSSRGLVTAGLLLVSTAALVWLQLDREWRRRRHVVASARAAHHRHLEAIRSTVRGAARQQRARELSRHPPPSALPLVVARGLHVGDRTPDEAAFLHVRCGVGQRPLSARLTALEPAPEARVDPAADAASRRLVAVHVVQRQLPVTVDLRAASRLRIHGTLDETRSLARAMTCSAVAFHTPGQLAVAVLAAPDAVASWEWVKWLPHVRSPAVGADDLGPRAMLGSSLAELTPLLPPEPGSHLLLVVDPGAALTMPTGSLSRRGLTILELAGDGIPADEDGRSCLTFDVGPGTPHPRLDVREADRPPVRCDADQCDVVTAEAVARRLARLTGIPGDSPARGLLELLELGDLTAYDVETAWRALSREQLLRTPLGTDDSGEVVQLDLKEAARGGIGPHGVVIGATGSGKSELLRTLVLGLALTHSPTHLNLVLVDFKGGATFSGMAALPHVAAYLTNLAGDVHLAGRMEDALAGELLRREELLQRSGDLGSVHDYERVRASGSALDALPILLVVVDEFSELLNARPSLLDVFTAIGRLGRSLGVHLLLASQRLDEGRLRGLDAHLSYRIALRTFSAQESQAVLGVGDAYELPRRPGAALLRGEGPALRRFQAAYVSGPLPGRRDADRRVRPWSVVPTPRHDLAPLTATPAQAVPTLVGEAVRLLAAQGPPAHQVWLPPLDVPETLDRLMPELGVDPVLGLVSHHWRDRGRLIVPLGTVDHPRGQRREVLEADLSGPGGHLAVVGGPRSGKSTLLRTLIVSLALTATPHEAQVYVLDLAGSSFASLAGLPHVRAVGTGSEPDAVRRIVAEVSGLLDTRARLFRDAGVESMESYRAGRAREPAADGLGDVFLVVDGWNELRGEFDDLEAALQTLAVRGLGFGVHLVLSSSRWGDVRATVRDQLGTRIELRLGDPADSELDRVQAAAVPLGRPGRGLTQRGLHFLTALPRVDGRPDPATTTDAMAGLVARLAGAWPGPCPPKLRMLPELVTRDALLEPSAVAIGSGLLLGIAEGDLAPVTLDPAREPHWIVLGDRGTGKSAALRGYAHEVMRTRTQGEAQLVLVDYRRSLLGEVPDDYLLHHLTSTDHATPVLAGLASHLASRVPATQLTPGRLAQRPRWSGAELFVVVDDYDLVVSPSGSPLEPLLPLLPRAQEVGLHVVVARSTGGASRAFYEPVLQSLRELAVPGLLLAGSPDEGPLVGGLRPTAAPPGRGRLVTRDRGVEVVQLAWRPPTAADPR